MNMENIHENLDLNNFADINEKEDMNSKEIEEMIQKVEQAKKILLVSKTSNLAIFNSIFQLSKKEIENKIKELDMNVNYGNKSKYNFFLLTLLNDYEFYSNDIIREKENENEHQDANNDIKINIPSLILPNRQVLDIFLLDNLQNLLSLEEEDFKIKNKRYLIDNDLINNSLSYRLFCHLQQGKDLYFVSSDLEKRKLAIDSYLLHICNYLTISKENSHINSLLIKTIQLNEKGIHESVNQELFLNKDVEELKQYYYNCYINKCFNIEKIKSVEIEAILKNQNIVYDEKIKGKTVIYPSYNPLIIKLLTDFHDRIINLNYNGDSKLLLEKKEEIQNLNTDIINYLQSKKHLFEENLKFIGFTKPKVLVVLPYKKHCLVFVNQLVSVLFEKGWGHGIGKKKKFREEFTEEKAMEDFFMMGISMKISSNIEGKNSNTIKTIDLFSSVAESDIIITSPIGLSQSKIEKCFLSSIEILLMDYCEDFIYQNLSFIEEIADNLNLFPKSSTELNDIYRIKDNYKEESIDNKKYSLLKNLRQNIFISDIKSLELENVFSLFTGNNANGMIYIKEKPLGVIDNIKKNSSIEIENLKENMNSNSNLNLKEKQKKKQFYKIKFEFKMLTIPNLIEANDVKFNFFIKNVR